MELLPSNRFILRTKSLVDIMGTNPPPPTSHTSDVLVIDFAVLVQVHIVSTIWPDCLQL